MLFKAAMLQEIAQGRVTLAFRRWKRSTVRAGGTLRTAAGVLAIDDVKEVTETEITEEDARAAGYRDREAVIAELRTRTEGATYRIAFHSAGADPRMALREIDALTPADLAQLESALAKLDRTSAGSPPAIVCLRLISEGAGRPAGALAQRLGCEKHVLKRKVRRLKELGLTESLQVGYRLSKRGQAVLASFRGK